MNRTDLLERLWGGEAATTAAVLAEYQAGVALGHVPASTWFDLQVIQLTSAETALAARLPLRLGPGERTCIAVAIRRQAELASDDLTARLIARQRGVPITGTLGALNLSIREGYLDRHQANVLLAEMIRQGYYSPIRRLDEDFSG